MMNAIWKVLPTGRNDLRDFDAGPVLPPVQTGSLTVTNGYYRLLTLISGLGKNESWCCGMVEAARAGQTGLVPSGPHRRLCKCFVMNKLRV